MSPCILGLLNVLKRNFIAGYSTKITGLRTKLSYVLKSCIWLLNFILFYRWTHQDDITHLDTPGWLVLTLKPYMEDTPASLGSTWNGHTWTHLDDIYPHGWFKIMRYTWKVRPHLETLNTGAMETLMDSSRQLLWILRNFFQTTLLDSSRQLLWILPDNSYGFSQISWISMTHDLTGNDVFWKVVKLTGKLT